MKSNSEAEGPKETLSARMAVANLSDPARSEWDRLDEIIRGLQPDGTLGPALFFTPCPSSCLSLPSKELRSALPSRYGPA